eukprot:Gb_08579 [translate_table: standard]
MGAMAMTMMIAAARLGGVEAQTGTPFTPPSSTSGCTNSIVSLSPCLNYIMNVINSSLTPPPQSCCTALGSVVKTSAVCLCQLFTNNNPLGFPVNQTQALALPGLCNVKTPPLSQCKAVVGGPATAPVASPGPARPTSKAGRKGVSAPAPATGGGKETPAGSGPAQSPKSDANSDGGSSPKSSPGGTKVATSGAADVSICTSSLISILAAGLMTVAVTVVM